MNKVERIMESYEVEKKLLNQKTATNIFLKFVVYLFLILHSFVLEGQGFFTSAMFNGIMSSVIVGDFILSAAIHLRKYSELHKKALEEINTLNNFEETKYLNTEFEKETSLETKIIDNLEMTTEEKIEFLISQKEEIEFLIHSEKQLLNQDNYENTYNHQNYNILKFKRK